MPMLIDLNLDRRALVLRSRFYGRPAVLTLDRLQHKYYEKNQHAKSLSMSLEGRGLQETAATS